MNLFNEYNRLCKKYDKLLNDYAVLLSKYKETDRLLHKISLDFYKKEYNIDYEGHLSNSSYCYHIDAFCLYADTNYCKDICTQKTKYR